MRIAVTGAFGYSGRYITKRLLEAGHEIIGVARVVRPKCKSQSFQPQVQAKTA